MSKKNFYNIFSLELNEEDIKKILNGIKNNINTSFSNNNNNLNNFSNNNNNLNNNSNNSNNDINSFLKNLNLSNNTIEKFKINEIDFIILKTITYEDLKNE
jgi:hypothetical protein